ncbi:hypothetical protein HYT23_07010 [Candidatus Pacearchaeota archaeon]|nr:hypothetical protein [Candidatus Pacearchaeota archaeon]
MLNNFLKEIVVMLVGKQAEPIADLLNSNKHVNEFLIAKKLNLTINQTRNILYKIADHGLVSSIRKKDRRKGWYTYFWKLEVLKSLEFLQNMLIKKIEQIKNQIKSREVKQFYICEKCNLEFSEENALLHDFTCPECGGVFSLKDNLGVLKELRKNLVKTDREMHIVSEEINKEKEKNSKKTARVVKKTKVKAKKTARKRFNQKKHAKKIKHKKNKRPSKKKRL